jgi:PPIC-type PPIASE domain
MRLRALLLGVLAASCELTPPTATERCLQAPALGGEVVARVGAIAITTEQLEYAVRAQGPELQRRVRAPGELKQFVEDQIRLELLLQAALERGLDKDPDVVAAARKIMVRKLLERDLATALSPDEQKTISTDAIEAYYERNRDKYRQPEMRRISHLQLAPTADGQALAASLLAQLSPRPDDKALWRSLASRYSVVEASKDRGAELPFATQAELAAEYGLSFAREAFTASSGAMVAAPVQSTRGWHVLRIVAAREELARPLDEVRDDIKARLMRDVRSVAFDRYLGELRARHPVELYESQLQELASRLAAQDAKAASPSP